MNGRIDGRCFCQTVTGSCFGRGNFSKDGARMASISALFRSGRRHFLVAARSNVGFAQNGYLFYVDEKGGLGMQAFDPDAGHVTGDVRLIAERSWLSTFLVLRSVHGLCRRHCRDQSELGCIPIGSHMV